RTGWRCGLPISKPSQARGNWKRARNARVHTRRRATTVPEVISRRDNAGHRDRKPRSLTPRARGTEEQDDDCHDSQSTTRRDWAGIVSPMRASDEEPRTQAAERRDPGGVVAGDTVAGRETRTGRAL